MSDVREATPEAEEAYRLLLRHTVTCGRCRAKARCAEVAELSHKWKAARR
ncbi:hypothetical protein AB0E82_02115 [Streptomyces anulatus]